MVRQTQFGGGELSPSYQERSDLPIYGRAVKKMRNFFAARDGGAVSRPGTLFVNTAKNPNDTEARLIPFRFSDGQAYALEFGAGYIRFHTNGGTLLNPVAGAYYQKTTVYQTAHLRGITYSQVGDVLTLTRKGYAAMELRRLPDWTLANLQALQAIAIPEADYARGLALISGTSVPDGEKPAFRRIFIAQDESAAEAIAFATGEAAYNAWLGTHPGDAVGAMDQFRASYYNFFEAALLGQPHWTFLPVSFVRPAPFFTGSAGGYPCIDSNHLTAEDATHPDQVWKYAVTLTAKDRETGRQFESLPYFITDSWDHNALNAPVALSDDLHSVYPDRHLIIYRGSHLDRPAANAPAPDYTFQELGWNIYKGHDRRVMGLIGTSQGDTFVDVGIEPDYATQPPMGTNPFLTYDYAGVLAQTETPVACCIFQDRRFFGGTQLRPVALFGSATGDYANFDLHDLVHSAGESILFELAALQGEKIVHLVPGRQMLIGTEANWRYFRGANGPVDFNSVDSNIIDNVGTRDLVPLVIDGEVLFLRTKGSAVRALKTDQGENFRGIDISVHADHLLRGKGTYLPTLGFKKRIVDWTYAEDPWGVAWAVREDGMLLSLTYQREEGGWAWHDSYTANGVPGLFKSVCAIPEGDEDAVYVLVRRALSVATPIAAGGSHAYLADPQGWVLCVERMTSRVRNNDAEDDACVDCGLRFEGLPTTTITGLTHLIGESVWFVSKGNAPQGPLVVNSVGEIELTDMPTANSGANVVGFVGLKYVPELETLNIGGNSANGRMTQKAVRKVGISVEQSSGILLGRTFGTDLEMLEGEAHTVASGYGQPDPTTALITSEMDNTWEDGGRICIRQSKPLPVKVIAIARDVDAGG